MKTGWLTLAALVAWTATLLLASCGEPPCSDEVLNPRAWYGNSKCSHSQHEMSLVDAGTWVCRCKKAAK